MIAIIDSGVANISSVLFALNRIGFEAIVTRDKKIIETADHVILPGVGTASAAMKNLLALDLVSVIQKLHQPVLGFCLGMQLLFESSSEGDVDCLGIIPGKIRKIQGDDLIIPHMGWNTLNFIDKTSTFENQYVYYVHSFCAPVSQYTIATTTYGETFTAIVNKDNFWGMQFHPERSGDVGEKLLKNFLLRS
ncbi:MAG: imidazole glycerol phosphate synthase subunit HisH [Gammaproteobacteria bacterium]|jgi:glutamine amidotransferase